MKIEVTTIFILMSLLPLLFGGLFSAVSAVLKAKNGLDSCILVQKSHMLFLWCYLVVSLVGILCISISDGHVSYFGAVSDEPAKRMVVHIYSCFVALPATVVAALSYLALHYLDRRTGRKEKYLYARTLDWKCGILMVLNTSLCLCCCIPVMRAEEAVGMRMYFLLN